MAVEDKSSLGAIPNLTEYFYLLKYDEITRANPCTLHLTLCINVVTLNQILPEKWRNFVSRKRFCALGLGLRLELGLRLSLGLCLELRLAEIRLNIFSVKLPFGQVY